MLGPHLQSNRVHNWPNAIQLMFPTSWAKIMDDVGMARTIKESLHSINVVARFWRDHMQQFGPDYEWNKQKARIFIGSWLNRSFIEALPFIDAVEDFNEYWAASHTADETAWRVLWIKALVDVWKNEVLKNQVGFLNDFDFFTDAQLELLHGMKWCLGNAAVGNDIPWQVAKIAYENDWYIGYHGYVSVASRDLKSAMYAAEGYVTPAYRSNFRQDDDLYRVKTIVPGTSLEMHAMAETIIPGERSPNEFTWGSGRILAYDGREYRPRGIYPKFLITEGGLVRDANGRGWLQPNDGWKHSGVTGGDIERYAELMNEVIQLKRAWNKENNNRLEGYVLFTSGANDWPDFEMNTHELSYVIQNAGSFKAENPKPNPKPNPPPPPPPPTKYEVTGLDISHHNRSFDGRKAAEAGHTFVICKASDGWVIDRRQKEPRFDMTLAPFTEEALNNGLFVGSYHYLQPTEDPIVQAELYLEALKQVEEQHLPPALDFEEPSGNRTQLIRDTKSWLEFVEDRTGVIPMIYTNVTMYNNYLSSPEFDKYPLWIANWTRGSKPYLPVRRKTWEIWQPGGLNGPENGVGSPTVDFDRFNGDMRSFLEKYGKSWLRTDSDEPPQPIDRKLREDFKRKIYVIHPTADEHAENGIIELAKELGITIAWSFDEAGNTLTTITDAYLWNVPDERKQIFRDWYATHYPWINIYFAHFNEEAQRNPLNKLITESSIGVANFLRALAQGRDSLNPRPTN